MSDRYRADYPSDADHATPAHDALCLWIQGNVQSLVRRFYDPWARWQRATVREWAVHETPSCPADLLRAYEDAWARYEPAPSAKTRFEVPLFNAPQYNRPQEIKGFVDVLVSVQVENTPALSLHEHAGWSLTTATETFLAAIEVKSSVPSFGALVRQLRWYKSLLRDEYHRADQLLWFVCAPEGVSPLISQALENEGYGFIWAPVSAMQMPSLLITPAPDPLPLAPRAPWWKPT